MTGSVALLGYGRFGCALGSLFEKASIAFRALDPNAEVPSAIRAESISDLVKGCSFVILATPVAYLPNVLSSLQPYLTPTQIVVDVGSVKVKPTEILAATLGRQIPWVGTHPLFGPISLALGERPLRVVVCPNEFHPHAVEQVKELYQTLGCQTLEQDPHAHDQVMAMTHALSFFVAKGMLDAGVQTVLPYAPPSFQAMSRTIEAVRSDAGHLYKAIERDNPYAAGARRRLLRALLAADRALLRARVTPLSGDPPSSRAPSLTIPTVTEASSSGLAVPLPEEAFRTKDNEIKGFQTNDPSIKQLIEDIDRGLLTLLARRARLAQRAAATSIEGAHDLAQERLFLETRRAWAEPLSLDADIVDQLFRLISQSASISSSRKGERSTE